MIMCVLLCYPVSIRIYYQQGGLFLVYLLNLQFSLIVCKLKLCSQTLKLKLCNSGFRRLEQFLTYIACILVTGVLMFSLWNTVIHFSGVYINYKVSKKCAARTG